jgi:hypothetical protein
VSLFDNLLKFLFLGMLFPLASASCLAAEHKQQAIQPTFARDAVAKVCRGCDVEIKLDAIPSYGTEITFRIQKLPLHGVLSNLHATSDHTASVTYHHDGSKSPLADEFTFRAQAKGQSVSEPSHCTITIIPPPASLVFNPTSLDFSELTLSVKRQMNVTMINRGGTMAEGRLILPKGFSAPTGERYHLSEGESNTLTIEFDPMEEREYLGNAVSLPSCGNSPLKLHGVGVSRFELMKNSPSEWRVKNLTDTPLRISFTRGEGWILPRETLLAPHECRVFGFQQAEADVGEGDGGVTNTFSSNSVVHLSDGLSEGELELPPPTRFLPAVVHTITPTELGSLSIGATTRIAFTLINRSEFTKHLTWQVVSPSGGGSDVPMSIDLKGGESHEISYDWKPTLPGNATITVIVTEGRSTRHELIWKATVIAATDLVSRGGSDTNHIDSEGVPPVTEQPQPSSPLNRKAIPPVNGCGYEVTRSRFCGDDTVLLKWPAEAQGPSRLKVKEQQVVFVGPLNLNKAEQGNFQPPKTKIEVIPIDSSAAKQEGDHFLLKLRGLSPGWHHLVLSQFSKEGSLEAQSQFQIRVPAKRSLWQRVKIPFGIFGITFLLFYLRKIRKG